MQKEPAVGESAQRDPPTVRVTRFSKRLPRRLSNPKLGAKKTLSMSPINEKKDFMANLGLANA